MKYCLNVIYSNRNYKKIEEDILKYLSETQRTALYTLKKLGIDYDLKLHKFNENSLNEKCLLTELIISEIDFVAYKIAGGTVTIL